MNTNKMVKLFILVTVEREIDRPGRSQSPSPRNNITMLSRLNGLSRSLQDQHRYTHLEVLSIPKLAMLALVARPLWHKVKHQADISSRLRTLAHLSKKRSWKTLALLPWTKVFLPK